MRKFISLTAALALSACATPPPPAPDPATGPSTPWLCDGGAAFATQMTKGGNIEVSAAGKVYWLPAVKAGSGARYTDKKVEFWEKGGAAMLNGAAGGPYTNCKR